MSALGVWNSAMHPRGARGRWVVSHRVNLVHPTRGRESKWAGELGGHKGKRPYVVAYGSGESQNWHTKAGKAPLVPHFVPGRTYSWLPRWGTPSPHLVVPDKTIAARRSRSRFGAKITTKVSKTGFLVFDSKRNRAKTVHRNTQWW